MWRKEPCLKLSAYLRECGTDECFRVLEESFEAPGEQDCIDWDTFFLEKNNQILGKKIEEFSRQRITDRKRMLAFAAARHPRLGAFSPARVLIKDTLKLIFKAMKDIEFVVVMMPGVEEADEESKIRAAPFSGVFRFSLENFRFSKLPDPPEPLNFARLNVVGLGGGRFVVAGGRKGKYRRNVVVNQHIWLFDGRSWEKIPACLDRLLGVAAVVPHREGLLILGGGNPQKSPYSDEDYGLPDVFFNLEKRCAEPFPIRPNFKHFFNVRKTFRFSSWLVVFATGECIDLMKTERYCFTTPKDPALCCNQFLAIDLDNPNEHGWINLPWLSETHLRDFEMFVEGTRIIIDGGLLTRVACPCCGPTEVANRNAYYLDLQEIQAHPYWRFEREFVQFDWGLDGAVTHRYLFETAQGYLRIGGSQYHTAQDPAVIEEVTMNDRIVASLRAKDDVIDDESPFASSWNAYGLCW